MRAARPIALLLILAACGSDRPERMPTPEPRIASLPSADRLPVRNPGSGERIRIAGDRDLYDALGTAVQAFGRPASSAPQLIATGTAPALRQLCRDRTGGPPPDIVMAARPIRPDEIASCGQAGVTEIFELALGHQAVALVHGPGRPMPGLTRAQLYLALARTVPVDGRMADNPHRNWRDIASDLPDRPIQFVAGLTSVAGLIREVVLVPECSARPECAALLADEGSEGLQLALGLRGEDVLVPGADEPSAMVAAIGRSDWMLGIVSLHKLSPRERALQPIPIDGAQAGAAAVQAGNYPLRRPAFLYADGARLTPETREFLKVASRPALSPPGAFLFAGHLVPPAQGDLARRLRRIEP